MKVDQSDGGTLVPFGKYKGQPVETLLADHDYLEWLKGQPGLVAMLENAVRREQQAKDRVNRQRNWRPGPTGLRPLRARRGSSLSYFQEGFENHWTNDNAGKQRPRKRPPRKQKTITFGKWLRDVHTEPRHPFEIDFREDTLDIAETDLLGRSNPKRVAFYIADFSNFDDLLAWMRIRNRNLCWEAKDGARRCWRKWRKACGFTPEKLTK